MEVKDDVQESPDIATDLAAEKILEVVQKKSRRRFRVIVFMVGMMGLFSLYFAGSYLLLHDIYGRLPMIVNDLQIFYQRDTCWASFMSVIKTDLIYNRTTLLYEDPS